MYAQDLCGFVGPCVKDITIPYQPHELSTMTGTQIHSNVAVNVSYKALDVADLGGSCSTNFLRTASLKNQLETDLGVNPCAPNMLIPPRLDRADPAWSACVAPNATYTVNIWDPPRALLSVQGLTPIATEASPTTTVAAVAATAPASAGFQPTGYTVPQTSGPHAHGGAAPSDGSLGAGSSFQEKQSPPESTLSGSISYDVPYSAKATALNSSANIVDSARAADPAKGTPSPPYDQGNSSGPSSATASGNFGGSCSSGYCSIAVFEGDTTKSWRFCRPLAFIAPTLVVVSLYQ